MKSYGQSYVCICILTLFCDYASGTEFTPHTISGNQLNQLKDYFEKEIRRIENKHEADILDLRRELNAKTMEIGILKEIHASALNEILDLKPHLSEIRHIKDEVSVTKAKEFEDGETIPDMQGGLGKPLGVTTEPLIDNGNPRNPRPVEDENRNNHTDVMKQKVQQHISAGNLESINNKGRTDKKRQIYMAGVSGVAFFATLKRNILQANQNQTIVFDNVVTNAGNGYHARHGIFSASTPGLYVFSFTVMPQNSHVPHAHCKLVRNRQTLVRLNTAHWDQSSHTVIVELKTGDLVSVVSEDAQGVDYHGDDYTSFSGFLLYDYSDVNPVVGK